MEEVLKMEYAYDQLIDDNPEMQKRVERGHVEGMRRTMLTFITSRFPSLAAQAQQQIEQIQNPKILDKLCVQLASVTTEDEARKLLQSRKTVRKRKS
jgi:hypothetical protein